jgi:hypothetical protein
MFEMRSTDELVRIAAAGGGFYLKASVRPTLDLVRIAAAAAQGARIHFSGLGMRPTDEIVRIAAAGKGSIVFDD